MTVVTPLYAMVHRLEQLALRDALNSSPHTHFELLQMIDQLKLAVETPMETFLRLVYQVSEQSRSCGSWKTPNLTVNSLPKMPPIHRTRLDCLSVLK
jgi:hypothetical protein